MGLIVPAVRTIYASIQDCFGQMSSSVGPTTQWIFDSQFDIIVNSILWIVITPIASTALGLTLALLLDRMRREVGREVLHLHANGDFVRRGVDYLGPDLRIPRSGQAAGWSAESDRDVARSRRSTEVAVCGSHSTTISSWSSWCGSRSVLRWWCFRQPSRPFPPTWLKQQNSTVQLVGSSSPRSLFR